MVEDTTYETNMYVQLVDCQQRAQCFSEVRYDVKLNLPRGQWFTGCVEVSFKVSEIPSKDVFFDFRGIKIAEYHINDVAVPIDAKKFKNHHVQIPTGMLSLGETNSAKIYFLNKYRKDSIGLHSFIDKVDG